MSQENQETNSDTYSSVDVPSSSSKKSDNFDFNDSSLVHTTFSYGDSGGSLLPTDSKVTSTKSFNNLNNLEDTTVFKKSWGNTQGFGFGHESFDPYNKDDEDALDPLPIPTEVSSQQKSNSPQNLATQMNTSESARDRPKAPPVPPPPAPPNPTSHRMIDVDNPEFSEIEDLPHQMVVNFHDMVNRTKWTIPLAPKEPFQILLESAISVVNKGLDRNSQNMATFLQTAVKAFERLLGEDVRRWNCEIQEYIWQAIVLFLRLFASKLRRTATDPDFPQEYFLIFSSVMNPHTSYHLHNTNRGIERLEIKIEPLIVEQFTTLNIENLKPDARFKLLAYAFAKFGGCDGMMEFLKTHVKEGVELEIVLLWLRGLSYKTVLKPRVLEKITEHALRYSIQQIQKIPESEWKCADVKENLHDLPFLQFIRTVQAILIIIAEDKPNEWIRQLDVIQLKYLLSVIQQAKLSGRLRAMEELNRLICEKGRNLESQPVQLALNITKNFSELMNWLRENQLIELLLRDNLHLPNFVDRLEKIFQAFLKEEVFELSDLEAIWQAQVGKHDVIQRNLHGLVASLAANFERPSQEVILDDLCVKIRESWAIASNREKSLLVDLIGKIVERSSRSEHLDQVIIPKTTELLWNLFQDKTLSQETIDLVLKSHYDIIDSARNSDDIRQEYINLCFEEIKKDSEFVVPILRHLQLLLKTKYTTWNQEKKLVKEEHVKIICQSIETYTKKMREFLNNNPHVTHQLPNISFDGKYSHFVHLQQRIDFLTFILEEGRELRVFGEKDQSSWLKMEYIKILWKSLIKNPLTDEDSRVGFELFAKQIPNLYEFDRILSFFNDCVLALDPRRLSERGLECFKTSLHTIKMKTTEKLVELEMKALEYLWQIVLEANLEVSTLATNLLVESLLIENTFSTPPPADKDINEFIQNCFTKLKQHYEWLTKEETSKQLKLKEMERMSRILKVLHFSVEQVDQKYDSERVRLPLYRATIGQCFSVKLLLTVDDLKSALENIQEVFDVDIEDNDLRHLKEHNIPVEVHDNMTLEYFKRYVVKEAIYQLPIIPKNPTRYVPSFQLMWHKPETELTRTNSNSMFTSPSVSEWKTLDGSDLRKTFREIYANAFCNNQFSVTFDTISPWSKPKRAQKLLEKQKSKRVNMGDDDFSSDVSLESSDSEFSYEDLEEIPPTEALLPSFQIADNLEYMEFLTNLIDLGKDCEDSELAIEARRLLSLLPIHMKIEQDLEAMAKNNTLMNIFSNSPSCTSHYFEVIEALILPARCIKKVKQSGSVFQGYFLCNNGLDQLLLALSDQNFTIGWDSLSRYTVFRVLSRLAKFCSLVVGFIKRRHSPKGQENQLMIHIPTRFNSFLFRRYADMISVNFDREMLRTPINCLKFIEDFKIQLEALRAFMMISWSASMGKMVLINHIDTPIVIRNEDALFLKYLNGDETNMCELLSIEAIEAFCLGLLSCDQMHRVVAPPTAKTSSDNIYTFLVDVLFTTDSELIRGVLITAALCIVQHCGPGESARAQFLIDLLFDNIDNVEEKTTSCASAYFSLLCRLVELCSSMFNLKINHLNNRIQLVLLWIEQAKQISSAQAESYPKDILLTGYLNLAAAMFRQLSPEEKSKLGSSVDGPQLIKMLFDEFLFPYSRSFLEMNAMDLLEQRGETSTGGSPYNLQSIQRSATYAGINQPGSSSMMPRSATVAHISRWVPVCGTDSSQKAAFDLIHELSYDNPQNFEVVFKTLVQIFYHKPFPTKIEWDYMPSFIPRGPSNFVGLKNAGATCYMNSVFQQMFMVESIRNAIINAPCGASLDLDSEENTRLSGGDKDEYVIQVLQSVQAIFAHLLGSDLQYYEPRSFWNTFMLNGTRVNLREQQDALEFFNQLTDAVDQGMKKVCDDPIFEKTFGGTFADQKICKDCPHRYEKEHLFTSISVDIRSHNSLADSLKEYVKGEILDNDNAYLCELCNKKVTAIKRLCIRRLPPVLIMQLKRFDFDWERNEPIKYNDFFEFPLEIDMEPYTAQGIEARENLESPQPQDMFVSSDDDNITMQTDAMYPRDSTKLGSSSSQNSFNTRYRLRGVLVHSGQANGGHYYSFIRSSDENGRSDWFKFDDVDVSPWELNQETMRDCWFGGEYTAEWMINRRNRSKRCWNAYLLVFEKITSEVSSMPQQSSIVPSPPVITSPNSPNYQKMEKSFGSITLTSQRAMNKMPAQLEKLIRRKNLLSLHERSQYAHVYFGFITELSLHISHILREFREKGLVIDQRKKILGYVCSQLLTYFLLQTGLHAHHNLVRHYLLKWLDTLEEFMHIQEVRIWWFKQIILHRDITPLYLFDCPNSEVRIMCVRIISALLVLGRNDMTNLTENVPQEYGVNSSFFDPNDTITLGTLRILVTYIQNRYTEFLHRPNNYLQILLQYLGTSLEAKKHFLKLNFLNKFLFLFTDARTRDDQRIRLLAQEAPIIFTLISSMLRICRVNCDFEDKPVQNPYALAKLEDLVALPEEIQSWVLTGNNLNRLLRLMIEYSNDRDMVRQTIAFLCFNNLPITRKALTFLSFDKCLSTSPNNEYYNSLCVFISLLTMLDNYTNQRVVLGVVGDFQYVTGYIIYMYNVRERSSRRALQLFREMVGLYLKFEHIREALVDNQTFKEYMGSMTQWLSENLRDQSSMNPFSRKYTRNLSPNRTNIDFLMKCEELWQVADTSSNSVQTGEEEERESLIPSKNSQTKEEIRQKGLEGWMNPEGLQEDSDQEQDETKQLSHQKPRGSFSERVKIFNQKELQKSIKTKIDQLPGGWSELDDEVLETSKVTLEKSAFDVDEFADFDINKDLIALGKNVQLKTKVNELDAGSDNEDELQPSDAMEWGNNSPMNVSPSGSPPKSFQFNENIINALEKAVEEHGQKTPEMDSMELPEIGRRSRSRQKASTTISGKKRDSGHFGVVPPLPSYEASLSQPRTKLRFQESSSSSPISRPEGSGVSRTVSDIFSENPVPPPAYEVTITTPSKPDKFVETAEEYTGVECEDEPPPVDP